MQRWLLLKLVGPDGPIETLAYATKGFWGSPGRLYCPEILRGDPPALITGGVLGMLVQGKYEVVKVDEVCPGELSRGLPPLADEPKPHTAGD